eukprot:Gb_00775 [translate_table: standard]
MIFSSARKDHCRWCVAHINIFNNARKMRGNWNFSISNLFFSHLIGKRNLRPTPRPGWTTPVTSRLYLPMFKQQKPTMAAGWCHFSNTTCHQSLNRFFTGSACRPVVMMPCNRCVLGC